MTPHACIACVLLPFNQHGPAKWRRERKGESQTWQVEVEEKGRVRWRDGDLCVVVALFPRGCGELGLGSSLRSPSDPTRNRLLSRRVFNKGNKRGERSAIVTLHKSTDRIVARGQWRVKNGFRKSDGYQEVPERKNCQTQNACNGRTEQSS